MASKRTPAKRAKRTDNSICANTPGMTPELAASLLEQDAKIVIADAVGPDGKLKTKLSQSARRQLQALAIGVETKRTGWADNKVQLAKALGMSRQMLHVYCKKKDSPKARPDGRWNIAEWKAYVGRADVSDEPEEKEPAFKLSAEKEALAQIRTRKLRDMDFDFGTKSRDYVVRDEVNEAIDAANLIVVREIQKALEHELPPQLEGLDAAEIAAVIHERLREIWEHLPKKIRKHLNARHREEDDE